MAKLTHKPAHFTIYREDGTEVQNATAYRLRVRSLRDFMENESRASAQAITLINTETRNSWTVTPDGRWI